MVGVCDISLEGDRVCLHSNGQKTFGILEYISTLTYCGEVLCISSTTGSNLNNMLFCSCSPELEKGLKKRVKLHAHENGENGLNGQNGEIDSDDNYTEVCRGGK